MRNPSEIFKNLIQIGIISNDASQTMKNLSDILGISQFRSIDYPPEDMPECPRYLRGKQADFRGRFCFHDEKAIEIEIIEPLQGENIWSEYLEKNGGTGLHHLKFLVEDLAEVKEHFDQLGIAELMSGDSVGKNIGRRWVYYDTYSKLGFYVEVMNEKKAEQPI